MRTTKISGPAEWTVPELRADASWIGTLDARARRDLIGAVRKAHVPEIGRAHV